MPAAPTRVNADDGTTFAGLLDDLAQRAEAATQEVPHFDKAAAVREPVRGLLLRGAPLKPSRYFFPVHATTPKLNYNL